MMKGRNIGRGRGKGNKPVEPIEEPVEPVEPPVEPPVEEPPVPPTDPATGPRFVVEFGQFNNIGADTGPGFVNVWVKISYEAPEDSDVFGIQTDINFEPTLIPMFLDELGGVLGNANIVAQIVEPGVVRISGSDPTLTPLPSGRLGRIMWDWSATEDGYYPVTFSNEVYSIVSTVPGIESVDGAVSVFK